MRQAGLSITLSLGESPVSVDFGSSLIEAGAYTGVAALIAGKAERAGEISAAHLWLTLDADARRLELPVKTVRARLYVARKQLSCRADDDFSAAREGYSTSI